MRHLVTVISLILTAAFTCRAQLDYKVDFPPIVQHRDTMTITVLGDVMMHSRQMDYPMETFLSEISPALRKSDLTIANMEFSLGGRPYTGYPSFSAPDEYADYARRMGIDVFLTANNHILDRGSDGLRRTLGIYRGMEGISFTGAYGNQAEMDRLNPLMLRVKNYTVAIINFTYGTNSFSGDAWPKVSRMDRKEVAEAIEKAKEQKADFILALPHWGSEYEFRHSSSQESWAHWLVSQGVNAIVGAHPHVVQDNTTMDGVPVFYSIGNCVSNMSVKGTRLGEAIIFSFVYDWFSGEKTVLPPEIRYTWCTLPGMLKDSYATIFVDEWEGRRDEWKTASDYDNMISTLAFVKEQTEK